MKIVHVTRQFYPAVGGIAAAVWHLSHHLKAIGHQANVIALNRLFQGARQDLASEENVKGITIRRVPYWGSRRYAIAPSVLQYVQKCDLIHLHSSDFFLDYLAWTKPFHKKPIVLTAHGMYFHTQFARIFKQIYFNTMTRLNLRQVSGIICVSHHDFELLSSIAPINKLHLIPNGIEYDKLAALDIHNRDPNLIISVGILATNKRYDKLLRAFSFVLKKQPTAKLVIIGPDKGLLSSLKKLSVELKVDRSVQFTGLVSDDELLSYLGQANLWVTASSYEAFGIALLEAMAAGCLPIVNPLPSFKHLLPETEDNFYADFDRPEQAANLMLKSLNLSPKKRSKIVTQCRVKASRYSWNTIVEQIQEVYTKAVESKTS